MAQLSVNHIEALTVTASNLTTVLQQVTLRKDQGRNPTPKEREAEKLVQDMEAILEEPRLEPSIRTSNSHELDDQETQIILQMQYAIKKLNDFSPAGIRTLTEEHLKPLSRKLDNYSHAKKEAGPPSVKPSTQFLVDFELESAPPIASPIPAKARKTKKPPAPLAKYNAQQRMKNTMKKVKQEADQAAHDSPSSPMQDDHETQVPLTKTGTPRKIGRPRKGTEKPKQTKGLATASALMSPTLEHANAHARSKSEAPLSAEHITAEDDISDSEPRTAIIASDSVFNNAPIQEPRTDSATATSKRKAQNEQASLNNATNDQQEKLPTAPAGSCDQMQGMQQNRTLLFSKARSEGPSSMKRRKLNHSASDDDDGSQDDDGVGFGGLFSQRAMSIMQGARG